VRAGKKATARTARRLTFSPPGEKKKDHTEREILDGSAPVETASVSVKTAFDARRGAHPTLSTLRYTGRNTHANTHPKTAALAYVSFRSSRFTS
jgi:hypothetical protein